MMCPPSIATILLDILELGLVRCRSASWANDPGRCALEADHVHNLPRLLRDFAPALLQYYWDVERPAFLEKTAATGVETAAFEPLWQQLRGQLEMLR